MREPYYTEPGITLYHGDCREVMAEMEPASIDTIITDPPYGMEFMGKEWDKAVPGPDFWKPALEVCKPGAMLMAFGGTRLYHRMTCAIEDSGWEIRDCLMWLYGSGFPKSHDISKAIDKAARAGREVVGKYQSPEGTSGGKGRKFCHGGQALDGLPDITAPATPEAELWEGWGTALKPAWEPIVLAMKPLDGTFAENALKHGVAGLNIDGGRIGTEERTYKGMSKNQPEGAGTFRDDSWKPKDIKITAKGRWPSNLMLDEDTAPMLDEQSGESNSSSRPNSVGATYSKRGNIYGDFNPIGHSSLHNDSGGASRFFYIAKPSKADRGHRPEVAMPLFDTVDEGFRNTHPTVKPTPLMERLIILQTYLARLCSTPTGGTMADIFLGSGTTAMAAKILGIEFIGMERDKENLDIAIERLKQL